MNYTQKLCELFYGYGGGVDFLTNPQHQANCAFLWTPEEIEEEVKKCLADPMDLATHDDFSDNWYHKYVDEFGDPKLPTED